MLRFSQKLRSIKNALQVSFSKPFGVLFVWHPYILSMKIIKIIVLCKLNKHWHCFVECLHHFVFECKWSKIGWSFGLRQSFGAPMMQVWSLTQFYSVNFSQSRIGVKSAFSINAQSRSVAVDGVLRHT